MATKKPAKKKKPAAKKPAKKKAPAKKPAKKTAVKKKSARKAAPKKSSKKAPAKKKPAAPKAPTPIGRVTHYFDQLEVAVIQLAPGKSLKVGDKIRIEGGETDFTQTIESLQVEHESVDKVKAGDDFGTKVDQLVREGYRVHKG